MTNSIPAAPTISLQGKRIMTQRVFSIPEVTYPWHTWWAWYPVSLEGGGHAWLRPVQRRKVWLITMSYEYREL